MHSFLKEIGEKYSIHQRIRILERMHIIIPHLYRFGEFKTWMHYFILVDFLKKRNAYRPRERPEYSKTQGKVYIVSVDLVTDDCRSFSDWSGLSREESACKWTNSRQYSFSKHWILWLLHWKSQDNSTRNKYRWREKFYRKVFFSFFETKTVFQIGVNHSISL